MSSLQTGAPHFKSLMKQYRHANYTLSKALNEFVDNAIKRATKIDVSTQVDDNQRLQELRVSDNIETGFDNMDQRGTTNPFNMGHIKMAHEDDSETSEFGVGMKAGALSAANQLNVYTRIHVSHGEYKYVEVICDFIRMSETENVNDSYNPFIREISREEYQMNHPFEQGSTIKLSKIRDSIYPRTTQQNITTDICGELSATYTRFLSNGSNITVNGTQVAPIYNFFKDLKCEPFTVKKDVFVLEKEGLPRQYIIRQTKENTTWQEYCREEDKWSKLKTHLDGLEYIAGLQRNGYRFAYAPFNADGVCLQLNTTFAFYSDEFHAQKENELPIPEDKLLIYKDDRCYGKESLFTHNNGCHNYTLHEMDFVSKRLGKDVGITFNKEISMNGKNELIMAIKSALIESKRGFSADTSSAANAKLCEKAIKNLILDPKTCPPQKLAVGFRPVDSSESDADSGPRPSAKTRKPRSSKKTNPVIETPIPDAPIPDAVPIPAVVQSAITTLNAWFREEEPVTSEDEPVTFREVEDPIEEVQEEPDNLSKTEDNVSETRRRRTIDVIVRLQKMIADELELSEEALSAIENAIA